MSLRAVIDARFPLVAVLRETPRDPTWPYQWEIDFDSSARGATVGLHRYCGAADSFDAAIKLAKQRDWRLLMPGEQVGATA